MRLLDGLVEEDDGLVGVPDVDVRLLDGLVGKDD